MLNAYNAWKQVSNSIEDRNGSGNRTGRGSSGNRGESGRSGKQSDNNYRNNRIEEQYCRENFLSLNALQMIEQMRGQFLELLKDIGFILYHITIDNITNSYENRNGQDLGMLSAVLCVSLAPNILQIPYTSRPTASGEECYQRNYLRYHWQVGKDHDQ